MRINVLAGPNAGASLERDAEVVTIGSDPGQCDLVLLDPAVAPRHLSIHVGPDGRHELRPIDSAEVVIDAQHTLQAPMTFVGPICARVGDTELLLRPRVSVRADDTGSDAPDPEGSETPRPARPRRIPMLLIGCTATGCVTLTWAVLSLMSAPATADPRRLSAPVTVSAPGTVPTTRGTVSHDQGLARRPALLAHDRAGSVLMETPSEPTPAPPPAPVRRTLSKLADGPAGPYLETQQGDRYPLSAADGDGFALHWQSHDEIVLRRNGQSIQVRIE
ncbi:MAG: Inner rane component of cytoplasmic domain [Pseudomonadota bacterium]|jgi:hypothetical protein